ncbi:TPA: hypothetical protein HA225_00625 [Candidatus Micrarchaeota archaeon]|nr:hypothetical protein [Candidatus Micrarchaeota archaeon]HIH30031.1 hypothetical protein [Candidatus Micrarchaeota archaeon]
MGDQEIGRLLARAKSLESKQLFVKAADYYIKAGMEYEAAAAFEKAAAYGKAEALFRKLGKDDDAMRCKEKREKSSSDAGKTWQDLQSEFQQDKGNPY